MNKNIEPMRCIKSTESSIQTRQCFMTGEYCSQQTNIQKERQRLHHTPGGPEINAFVIMNFSSMSDVVYESRIKQFIESLKKYLFLDVAGNRIACVSTGERKDLNDPQPISLDSVQAEIIRDLRKNNKETINKICSLVPALNTDEFKKTAGAESFDEKTLIGLLHSCDQDGKLEALKLEYRWKEVRKINIYRADSNPVSNYIICNRICQQMQTADLIIVDVSVETANVFYEFGLATAFRKLILPICFSESFYEMELPERLEDAIREKQNRHLLDKTRDQLKKPTKETEGDPDLKYLEKHIDCYPWRRKLFEHFGIRYQRHLGENASEPENSDSQSGNDAEQKTKEYNGVRYLDPQIVFSEKYGFSDYQYNHFPYDATKNKEKVSDENPTIGRIIYDWLKDSYNKFDAYQYNTLVIYTMDRILNKDQAGQCIVNFFYNITQPMIKAHCFCGDRVAILGQSNHIWDDPKDKKSRKGLLYSVSDLVRIGMDQATYEGERRRIKTSDYLSLSESDNISPKWKANADQVVKTHIRNRAIPLNPETPIYVSQFQEGIQQNLDTYIRDIRTGKDDKDSKDGKTRRFVCLYHTMLNTLRYVNEIVVDLSSNSVQSLFWLGAAHGANIYTITVRHEMSENEKAWSGTEEIRKDRPIFDIGGLWTAMLRYNETGSFYRQLSMIQQGIEQHSKLMLPEAELAVLEENTFKELYGISKFPKLSSAARTAAGANDTGTESHSRKAPTPFQKQCAEKNAAESKALESYYRDTLWRHMLRDNQLHLFLPMSDSREADGPRLQVIKWDVDAVAELSHYLSKRKVIGKYHFDTLRKSATCADDPASKTRARGENCICIGNQTNPFADADGTMRTLAAYINHTHYKTNNTVRKQVHEMKKWTEPCRDSGKGEPHPVFYRGFVNGKDAALNGIHEQFFPLECIPCLTSGQKCRLESKPLEFPDEIHLRWEPGADGQLFTVSTIPENACIDNCRLQFTESEGGGILAQLYCSFSGGRDSGTQMPGNLDSMFHPLFCGGLTLKKDDHDELRYILTNSSGWAVPIELVCAVLQHCSMVITPGTAEDPRTRASICALPPMPEKNTGSGSSSSDPPGFDMPAQLLLWREKEADDKSDYKYHISLVGVSGPATAALTALLVDKDQKTRILHQTHDDLSDFWPLNRLQTHIRVEFFKELEERLRIKLGIDEQSPTESNIQIIYLVKSYLSTIVYRYFLPFLSRADEQRIRNALEAFLLTLDSRDEAEFDPLVKQKSKDILDVLNDVLRRFRGVEAFYRVHVSVDPKEDTATTDNRKIRSMTEWCKENSEDPVMFCLFRDFPAEEKSKQEKES